MQTDRLEGVSTPLLAENIPDVANRQERNVLYNHTQAIESNIWVVQHNLGTNPVVQVAVNRPDQDEPVEIEPQLVEIIDKNTTRITFDRNESGIAQFISRSSSSSVVTDAVVAEPTQFQLTSNGYMTVATPIGTLLTPASQIRLIYVDSAGGLTAIAYGVEYPPNNDSPWSDAETIVLNGREYQVGTLDMTGVSLAIAENETFYFDGSLYGDAADEDIVLLLSLSPYQNPDRIQRRVIFSPQDVTPEQSISTFAFVGGEHFAVDTLIEDVYPPVFVV